VVRAGGGLGAESPGNGGGGGAEGTEGANDEGTLGACDCGNGGGAWGADNVDDGFRPVIGGGFGFAPPGNGGGPRGGVILLNDAEDAGLSAPGLRGVLRRLAIKGLLGAAGVD
jgi:hypothetical protein